MQKLIVIVFAFLLISMPGMVLADTSHNHDPALVGEWFASSSDGTLTELTLESGGKFILDQRNGTNIERSYMCGTWERTGALIDLEIQAHKKRRVDGGIEESTNWTNGRFKVVKASRNTLILEIDQAVVSLYRNAPAGG